MDGKHKRKGAMVDNMPNLDNLTQDQIEKLQGVKSVEELFEFADEEDIEFTSEQLESISGGGDYNWAAASGYMG